MRLSFILLIRVGEDGQQPLKKITVEGKGAEQGWCQTSFSAFLDNQRKHTAMDSYILAQFTNKITQDYSSIPIPGFKSSHRSFRKGLPSASGHSDPFLFQMTSMPVAA